MYHYLIWTYIFTSTMEKKYSQKHNYVLSFINLNCDYKKNPPRSYFNFCNNMYFDKFDKLKLWLEKKPLL